MRELIERLESISESQSDIDAVAKKWAVGLSSEQREIAGKLARAIHAGGKHSPSLDDHKKLDLPLNMEGMMIARLGFQVKQRFGQMTSGNVKEVERQWVQVLNAGASV